MSALETLQGKKPVWKIGNHGRFQYKHGIQRHVSGDTKPCQNCGKTIYRMWGRGPSIWNKRRYCSLKCANISKDWCTSIRNCPYCLNDFKPKRNNQTYCSKSCGCRSRKQERAGGWQGGKVALVKLLRERSEYKDWRSQVFKRDNYTCQDCGAKGVYLNAHHILALSKYPKFFSHPMNGITLCEPCHRKTDNYGLNIPYYREASYG